MVLGWLTVEEALEKILGYVDLLEVEEKPFWTAWGKCWLRTRSPSSPSRQGITPPWTVTLSDGMTSRAQAPSLQSP